MQQDRVIPEGRISIVTATKQMVANGSEIRFEVISEMGLSTSCTADSLLDVIDTLDCTASSVRVCFIWLGERDEIAHTHKQPQLLR